MFNREIADLERILRSEKQIIRSDNEVISVSGEPKERIQVPYISIIKLGSFITRETLLNVLNDHNLLDLNNRSFFHHEPRLRYLDYAGPAHMITFEPTEQSWLFLDLNYPKKEKQN